MEINSNRKDYMENGFIRIKQYKLNVVYSRRFKKQH